MTQRKQQRESVLLRAIQDVVSRGLADPRIRGLITITGIKLSDDGKNATVMVSVLPEDRQDLTMHGLKAASAKIRKDAMAKVRLRDMPVLEFATDGTIKEQAALLGAINRAAEATGIDQDPEHDRPDRNADEDRPDEDRADEDRADARTDAEPTHETDERTAP